MTRTNAEPGLVDKGMAVVHGAVSASCSEGSASSNTSGGRGQSRERSLPKVCPLSPRLAALLTHTNEERRWQLT